MNAGDLFVRITAPDAGIVAQAITRGMEAGGLPARPDQRQTLRNLVDCLLLADGCWRESERRKATV
ncbi:MAG: hypothetical protein ACREDY_20425 [Bradyrhizobium sp.]